MKNKHRLEEAIRLLVTRGAWVEESRKIPKLVFRAEDVIADEDLQPGVCCPQRVLRSCGEVVRVLLTMGWSHTDGAYNLIVPTSEMSCV
jgi:hypothetical protein